jgi:dihydroorotate dehydrogenase (fumarate)
MADLKTAYMGLTLHNPIIVSSSRLTSTLDGIRRCEDAGAGAVVLKSIFEEQIDADS